MHETAPAKRPSLLDIADDMQALDAILAEQDGDISDPEVAAYVDSLFAETGDAFNAKVDSYCGLIRQKELTAAARKEESERLAQRAKTESSQAGWLKSRLKAVMEMRQLKKAGNVRTASVCGNGGKQPVEITGTVPAEFQTVNVVMPLSEWERLLANGHTSELMVRMLGETNLNAIRTVLESGKTLPFATLGERGTHLRVK